MDPDTHQHFINNTNAYYWHRQKLDNLQNEIFNVSGDSYYVNELDDKDIKKAVTELERIRQEVIKDEQIDVSVKKKIKEDQERYEEELKTDSLNIFNEMVSTKEILDSIIKTKGD